MLRAAAARGVAHVQLVAQALVEEPAEEEEPADGEEGDGAGERAQVGEVVEEELREAEAEEGKAGQARGASAPREAEGEEAEAHEPPEGADGGVPTLEVRLHARPRDGLGDLQDDEGEAVEGEHRGADERPRPVERLLGGEPAPEPGNGD